MKNLNIRALLPKALIAAFCLLIPLLCGFFKGGAYTCI